MYHLDNRRWEEAYHMAQCFYQWLHVICKGKRNLKLEQILSLFRWLELPQQIQLLFEMMLSWREHLKLCSSSLTVNRKRVKMMIPLLTLNLSSIFSICLTVIDVVTCSVNNNNTTVGHSPRKFSCLLWHFLSHRGEMECEVTGKEWHFLSFKVDWRFLAM